MDNKILNINGKSKELLAKALEVAFEQEGYSTPKVCAFSKSKTHGLILYWTQSNKATNLPVPLTHQEVLPLIWAYLHSDEAKEVECKNWDADYDHDGHNSLGWRVYCEDWGHVDHDWAAICAVKPVYLWYGK